MKKAKKKVELLEIYDVEGYQNLSDGGSSSKDKKGGSGSKNGGNAGKVTGSTNKKDSNTGNRGAGGNVTTSSKNSSNNNNNNTLKSSNSNSKNQSNNATLKTATKTAINMAGNFLEGAVGLGSKLLSTTMGETKGNKTVKKVVTTTPTKKVATSPTPKLYNGNDYKSKIVTNTSTNVLDSKLSDPLKGTLKTENVRKVFKKATEDTENTKKGNVLDDGGVYRTSQVTNKIGSEEKGVEQNIGYSSKLMSVNEEFNTGKDTNSPIGEILGTAEEKNITNGYENAVASLDNNSAMNYLSKFSNEVKIYGTAAKETVKEIGNDIVSNVYVDATVNFIKEDIFGGAKGLIKKGSDKVTKGLFSTDGNETDIGDMTIDKKDQSIKIKKGVESKAGSVDGYIKAKGKNGVLKAGLGVEGETKGVGDIKGSAGAETGISFDGNNLGKDGSFKTGVYINGKVGEKEGEKSKEKEHNVIGTKIINKFKKDSNQAYIDNGIEEDSLY